MSRYICSVCRNETGPNGVCFYCMNRETGDKRIMSEEGYKVEFDREIYFWEFVLSLSDVVYSPDDTDEIYLMVQPNELLERFKKEGRIKDNE